MRYIGDGDRSDGLIVSALDSEIPCSLYKDLTTIPSSCISMMVISKPVPDFSHTILPAYTNQVA